MASNSDDSYTAPIDFHLSTVNEDFNGRMSIILDKCPLCKKARKKFYCQDCVRSGDFVHSTCFSVERFAEKQVLLRRWRNQRQVALDYCELILRRKMAADKLRCEIDSCSDRISLLRSLTSKCKEDIGKCKATANNLQEVNRQRADRLPRYQERVAKLERYARQAEEDAGVRREEVGRTQKRLKEVVRTRSAELLHYIFPISEIIPLSRSEEEGSEDDSVSSALAEASHMAYVRGRWVFSDCSGELHHRIVAPMLPVSGDYSAYSMWVAANKDGVPGAGGGSTSSSESVEHNPAYTISAALTYITQLVNILAFYLDVRLPRKQCYSDFCRHEMSDQQFTRRVARLNANVLHLCFSQNVPPTLLHPARTLHNLLHLLDTQVSDLGRQGPVEVDPDLARSLEDQLSRDLEAPDGSDDGSGSEGEEAEDLLPGEWEAVPSLPYQESGAGAAVGRSSVDTGTKGVGGYEGSTSVAGGLVTSAAASLASIWRGWTTNK